MVAWSRKSHAKKFWKAGGVLAVFVFAAIALTAIHYFQKSKTEHFVSPRYNVRTVGESKVFLDSDEDGLKDWEETIYGTSPTKPDTDSDGIKDGEEIALNRDPLKAGPKDSVEARGKNANGSQTLKNLPKDSNITNALFAQVINGENFLSMLKGDTKNITKELLDYIEQIKGTAPVFSENSVPDKAVTISEDVSGEAIKKYFNAVAAIYEKNISPLAANGGIDESKIISEALKKKDQTILQKLNPLISAVEKTNTEVTKLPAPRSLVALHKREVWYLQTTINQLGLIKDANIEDPLYLLVLMSSRNDLKKEVTEFRSKEIPAWILERNIVFSQNDKAVLLYPQLNRGS